ncbi:hypothetical protein PAMA_005070 [Pampus argenteus]
MAHILCIVALLCFTSCVENTVQGFKDFQPQQDSLSWLDKLQDDQELTQKQNLAQLLYKLFTTENGNVLQGTEQQEKERRGLKKGTTTQARRAGCRVFFWKSWTAC